MTINRLKKLFFILNKRGQGLTLDIFFELSANLSSFFENIL